ncbi:SDR family oxidoreductase [Sphaerisporangium fuscum]|uniref:SDR family oxidoreductase n=1 Tax=Sphaerisporangium fuscum TaxID=2835868 RepID=UPI001BDC2203|nr:SDR family oxidoreductase [Sphaerisporangium fuscum]
MTSTAEPTVLITGASSGIGLRTAIAAAQAGFLPIATMRDLDRAGDLRKAAADAGVTVDVRRLDVTDEDSIDACLRGVAETHGRLDALVNNAGIANTFPTIEMSDMATYRANLEVNFFGVVAVTRAALPHLRASRGRVVTVGSTRGIIAQPFNEAYSAAKFAVEGFLESLAPVVSAMGVTVTIVEPGPVFETSFAANAGVTRDSLLAAAGPYAEVLRTYMDWVARSGYPGAQTATEVAEVVLRALTDPRPPFRIPTSEWAREYAAVKLTDPDGSAVQAMTRSWCTEERPAP